MSICIIILNYNDSGTVERLVDSIIEYEMLNRIIIVDNCSTDDSYVKLYTKYQGCDKVSVILTDKNGGYGYGNNVGIKYAYYHLRADYILITNPDVEFSNELVKRLINALNSNERNAVASALPITPEGNIQFNAAWNIPSPLKYLLMTSSIVNRLMKPIYLNELDYKYSHQVEVDCVAGSLLMVKADIMVNYGMYDESIFLYCEETVLGFKFKKAGYKTILLTNIMYTHYHSVTINKSYQSEIKKRRLLHKSKIIVLKKYYELSPLYIILSKVFLSLCLLEAMCKDLFKMLQMRVLQQLKK
ncbi:MAG: glycosyltransferase family 2 protein [Bacilli bacterium]|nr:glycosyltransferase family 2 protein [Bacilli bacterium]